MKANIQLIDVVKLDTFDNQTYEAHVRCLNPEDARSLVSIMENRSSINGFDLKGFHYKFVARIEEVLGEDGVRKEYKLSRDLYLTFKSLEENDSLNMTNLLWDIDSVIK